MGGLAGVEKNHALARAPQPFGLFGLLGRGKR